MYKLHVIKNPNGTFGYVGKAPGDIAFDTNAPELIGTACKFGPGLARRIADREGRIFRTRVFGTEAEARLFAENHGFQVIRQGDEQ